MKKLVAILVSAVMIFAMCATVFAEAPAAVTWEDYQQYLIDTAGSNAPDLQEFTDQVMAISSWDELDQTVSPWDQMFTTIGLSTWEEFEQGIVKEAQVPAGENMGGGESAEGESPEGESPEGESPEGEAPAEGESPEGESAEGESAGGESAGESKGDEELVELQNEEDGSALAPLLETSFSGTKLAYPRFATYLNEDATEAITDDVSWHNGAVYSEAGEYNVAADITMNTTADGSDTNDFSGLGAAVVAFGPGTLVNITDANIETTGVAKLALFTDGGAVSVVKGSTLTTNSGTIYDGYMSTADQTLMVSPPWVLGLGGPKCNTRTTNIMGDYSTAAYVDSTFNAGGWGALSTDSGTNMHMVVVNTEVNVEDSGYGAYTIGQSTEDYYGVTENVSTYANIMTGGVSTYQSYTGGEEIDVVQFSGEQDEYGFGTNGEVVTTVKSDKVADGEVVNSVINSENFGFMCHANGTEGYNIVNVLDGTEVNTKDAIFLVKKINSIFNVDNATLNSENGVILQIIDNDDDYVGLDMEAQWGEDNGYGHYFGTHMPTFNSVFHEEEGYANEFAVNESTDPNWTSVLNITNSTLEGDVWNSTGYVGANPATSLLVNLQDGANLTGIISAGAFSHTTKDATVGDGDWSQASALGHVTNIVNSNGKNTVDVCLGADAVWNVTADCMIDSLTIEDDAAVIIPADVTLTVNGEEFTATTLGAEGFAALPADDAAEAPADDAEAPAADAEAAPADAAEAPADDEAMLEAYKAYMIDFLNAENEANATMTDEQIPEFMACIEANDYSKFPGDMFFNGMLETGVAMTYDEFVASQK